MLQRFKFINFSIKYQRSFRIPWKKHLFQNFQIQIPWNTENHSNNETHSDSYDGMYQILNKNEKVLILTTLVHGNKAILKRPSLALLRCKLNFSFFELGHIAVQLFFRILELCLIAVQTEFQNFRAWPYCGANWL